MSSSLATRQRTGHIQCPTGCRTSLSACPAAWLQGSALVIFSVQMVAERGYLHVQQPGYKPATCSDSVSNWLQNEVICMSSSLATRQRNGHIQCPNGCRTRLSACPAAWLQASDLLRFTVQLVAERGYLHVQEAHCPDLVSNWSQNVVICMSRQLTAQIQCPTGFRT
jgi:hypothetical protein